MNGTNERTNANNNIISNRKFILREQFSVRMHCRTRTHKMRLMCDGEAVANERLGFSTIALPLIFPKMALNLLTLFHGANVSNLHCANSNTISQTNLISISVATFSMPFTSLIQFFLHFRCQSEFLRAHVHSMIEAISVLFFVNSH